MTKDQRPVVTPNSSMGENTHGELIEGVGDNIQQTWAISLEGSQQWDQNFFQG